MSVDIQKLAKTVLNAQRSGTAIPQLSETESFTLEEAYRVQVQSIEYRKVEGEHRVGMKMGFTSRAKMVQMGVDDMIWGRWCACETAAVGSPSSCSYPTEPGMMQETSP